MDISVKEIKPCRRRIKIVVPAAQVAERFDRFWKEFGTKARVPGFRVGKAPREVLESRFADHAREEVVRDLISKSYWGAIQEKGVHPVAHPEFSDIRFKNGESLRYEAQVDVRPEFKLHNYAGLPVKRKPVEMTDVQVDETLEHLRKRHAQYVEAGNRPLAVSDFCVMDYQCSINGQSVEERKNFGLELGNNGVLPSLRTGLIGMKTGETRDIEVEFPKEFDRKDWAGKKGLFKVTLKEIKEARLPALDDEFAKDLGKFESLEALRRSVGENGLRQKERLQHEDEWSQIIEQLLKRHTFDIPESVRIHQEEHLWGQTQKRLVENGWSKERIGEEAPKIRKELRQESVNQVRVAYLIHAIAKKEGIRAEEGEVNERIAQLARTAGMDPERLKKQDTENRLRDEMLERILNEKVVAFLLKKASVTEESGRIIKP